MKKIMIIMLMGIISIIPFNTHAYDNGYQYGLPTYQLDQKIPELNGYTLRQVFEDNVETIVNKNMTYRYYIDPIYILEGDYVYVYGTIDVVVGDFITYDVMNDVASQITNNSGNFSNVVQFSNMLGNINKTRVYTSSNSIVNSTVSFMNMSDYGLESLTNQQLDHYFKYYQLALRYELDNKEAIKDPGQYKHIFMSIYEGLTNLMRSMGSVWRFLTTPFVDTTLSDMDNLFSIDWSWDIFDVLRQWITNMAVWILQLNAVLIGTLFLILGIPIKVSILSLVFSDLVFVILGWIMIKSFII